jgi:hypothetical protein
MRLTGFSACVAGLMMALEMGTERCGVQIALLVDSVLVMCSNRRTTVISCK